MKYFSSFLLILMTSVIVQSYYYQVDIDQKSRIDYYDYYECPIIGIDLGMTHSCVGIWKNGQVEIIKNEKGKVMTPSVVSFLGEKILVGEEYKNINQDNELQTVYDVKKFIGKSYDDFYSHKSQKILPYQILDQDQKPYIKIHSNSSSKLFAPEQISAIVLQQIKRVAQLSSRFNIENAIITVPAYFNNQQRQATKKAAKTAGLNVVRLLNQPTAAAIAYDLDKIANQQKILVIDLGSKTLDISSLVIDDGVFEIIKTNGDVEFGGYKFNQILVDHFVNIFKIKFLKDISKDTIAMIKLQQQIQKAKSRLCVINSTKIEIQNIVQGYDFSQTLTRTQFEQMNADLFNDIISQIQTILDKSQFTNKQINHIILVGKDTRIPKIKSTLQQVFENSIFHFGIHPYLIKCFGAAKFANFNCHKHSIYDQGVTLIDVTVESIGVEVENFMMQTIFPKRTPIPSKKTKTFTTTKDNQTTVTIYIYQGSDFLTKYNRIIGVLNISDIPPSPQGEPQIQVTFQLTFNSNLLVSAIQKKSGKLNNISVTRGVGIQIQNMQKHDSIRSFMDYEQQNKQQTYQQYLEYSRDQL